MIRPTLRALLLALCATVIAPGCRQKRAPAEIEVPAPTAPAPLPVPVDRTLPDELAEGAEKAFGFPIPRRMIVRGRYPDTVYAAGEVPADKVANYVRQHVAAEKVETGPVKTLFPRAVVRGQPGVAVAIEVTSRGSVTELQVRNVTPVVPAPGLTDEERWRAAGFKPDGTPLDPDHLR